MLPPPPKVQIQSKKRREEARGWPRVQLLSSSGNSIKVPTSGGSSFKVVASEAEKNGVIQNFLFKRGQSLIAL